MVGSTGGGFPEFLGEPTESFPHGVFVNNPHQASLAELTAKCMEYVEENITDNPAILFRNLPAQSSQDFSVIAQGIPWKRLTYEGGASFRTKIDDNVGTYTANNDPDEISIDPHNEMSYTQVYPSKVSNAGGESPSGGRGKKRGRKLQVHLITVTFPFPIFEGLFSHPLAIFKMLIIIPTLLTPQVFFFCVQEPADGCGGETPLVKNSELLSALDPNIVKRFEEKQVRYVRYLPDKCNEEYLNWQHVYQTDDREVSAINKLEALFIALVLLSCGMLPTLESQAPTCYHNQNIYSFIYK